MGSFVDTGLFLVGWVIVSLSGVIAPGPVFAATIAKGYGNKRAGVEISIGHGIVEFPLMALIFFFSKDIQNSGAFPVIGVIGGLVLVYMGFGMVRFRKEETEEKFFPYPSVLVGVITTISNPYFLVWWATVGAAFILIASGFGVLVVILFSILHWSCDFIWNSFVSIFVHKIKRFWSLKVREMVFAACGLFLLAFGILFLLYFLLR